jgi:hypothetical protein
MITWGAFRDDPDVVFVAPKGWGFTGAFNLCSTFHFGFCRDRCIPSRQAERTVKQMLQQVVDLIQSGKLIKSAGIEKVG